MDGLKEKLDQLNMDSPRASPKNQIYINGAHQPRRSYDQSMNSTPDRENDIIGQAIGINVKSREVGTGYRPSMAISPRESPRNFINSGGTQFMKYITPGQKMSQQDIKLYLKHNRQYSTISKRYNEQSNIKDLVSQRTIPERAQISMEALAEQIESQDTNTVKMNLMAQNSPDTCYRTPNNADTAQFTRELSQQLLVTNEKQSSKQLLKNLVLSYEGQADDQQSSIPTSLIEEDNKNRDVPANRSKFDPNFENDDEIKPIYEIGSDSPNVILNPGGFAQQTGEQVPTILTGVLSSARGHQSRGNERITSPFSPQSTTSPQTGITFASNLNHEKLSSQFKVSFNKLQKNRKQSPNADLGPVQVSQQKNSSQSPRLRQKFMNFQKEVKNNFNEVMVQMAQVNTMSIVDNPSLHQVPSLDLNVCHTAKGITPKKVEFSFEQPLRQQDNFRKSDQNNQGRLVKVTEDTQLSPSDRTFSPKNAAAFSPRNTIQTSQGFGNTIMNTSFYKKNKLHSNYNTNIQRPQGLTTAPHRHRGIMKRAALNHQKQLSIYQIQPKQQSNYSQLRVSPGMKKVQGQYNVSEAQARQIDQALLHQQYVVDEEMARRNVVGCGSSGGDWVQVQADNKIKLEENPSMNQKTQIVDDKSSLMMSGSSRVPVLKLYGKNFLTTEKSIDRLSYNEGDYPGNTSEEKYSAYLHKKAFDLKSVGPETKLNEWSQDQLSDSHQLEQNSLFLHQSIPVNKNVQSTFAKQKQKEEAELSQTRTANVSRKSIARKRSLLSILSGRKSSSRGSPMRKKKEKHNEDLGQIYLQKQRKKRGRKVARKRSSQFVLEDNLLLVNSVGLSMQSSASPPGQQHIIPMAASSQIDKQASKQQLNSFHESPRHEIQVPELPSWKPLASNRILKNPKQKKPEVVVEAGLTSGVSSALGQQTKEMHMKDLRIDNVNPQRNLNYGLQPFSSKRSSEGYPSPVTRVQIQKVQLLQSEFVTLCGSMFGQNQRQPFNSMNPSMVTVNTTQQESAADNIQLAIEKIQTELMSPTSATFPMRPQPLNMKALESVSSAGRSPEDTEIKDVSELRITARPVEDQTRQLNNLSQYSIDNSLEISGFKVDLNDSLYQESAHDPLSTQSRTRKGQVFPQGQNLYSEEMLSIFETFENLKNLESFNSGKIPLKDINTAQMLQFQSGHFNAPSEQQLEMLRNKLEEISQEVEKIQAHHEEKINYQNKDALTSRKMSPAKIARNRFAPQPHKKQPKSVKNSSLTNTRYTFNQLKKHNREKYEQQHKQRDFRQNGKDDQGPVFNKQKLIEINNVQRLNCDQQPSKQAKLYKGVLKKISSQESRDNDGSTQMDREDREHQAYGTHIMNSFVVSKFSNALGSSDALLRESSRNGVTTTGVNRNVPSKSHIFESKPPPSGNNLSMVQSAELEQRSGQLVIPNIAISTEQSQPELVTGSSAANLPTNRSCIVLLEQARQHMKEKEHQEIETENRIKEVFPTFETSEIKSHEKLALEAIEEVPQPKLIENLKNIHNSIVMKEKNKCFDQEYFRSLNQNYRKQQQMQLNPTHLYSKKYSYKPGPALPSLSLSNETIQNSMGFIKKIETTYPKNKTFVKLKNSQQDVFNLESQTSTVLDRTLQDLVQDRNFLRVQSSYDGVEMMQPSVTHNSISIGTEGDEKIAGQSTERQLNFDMEDSLHMNSIVASKSSIKKSGKLKQLEPLNQLIPRSRFKPGRPILEQVLPSTKSFCTTKKQEKKLEVNDPISLSRGGLMTSLPKKQRQKISLPNVLNTDRLPSQRLTTRETTRSGKNQKDLGNFINYNRIPSLNMTKNQDLIKKYQTNLDQIESSAPFSFTSPLSFNNKYDIQNPVPEESPSQTGLINERSYTILGKFENILPITLKPNNKSIK